MKRLLIPIVMLAGALLSGTALSGAQYPINNHHCGGGGVSLVITGEDRFDPLVQQLLLKQQMSGHRIANKPRFIVIPYNNGEAELTEVQIRYLEMLLSNAAREDKAAKK
ncbi:MAG: hypothetical protein V7707_12690 [Motiliproteus sp.]